MKTFTITTTEDGAGRRLSIPFSRLCMMQEVGELSIVFTVDMRMGFSKCGDIAKSSAPTVTMGFDSRAERDARFDELLAVWGDQ